MSRTVYVMSRTVYTIDGTALKIGPRGPISTLNYIALVPSNHVAWHAAVGVCLTADCSGKVALARSDPQGGQIWPYRPCWCL